MLIGDDDEQLQWRASAYLETWKESPGVIKLSVSCRVSLVALAVCSPADSVCPPCPEHAPPPLSELFPWQ